MTGACVGEPISWLRLERHALGELGADAAEVAAHVARCAACRAALDAIERDARALPPLRAVAAAPAPRRRWWLWAGGLAAAAAALLLFVRRPDSPEPGPRVRVKGAGVLEVSLVRDRAGAVTVGADTYVPGDRFKVRVTCSAPTTVRAEVVVTDDDGVTRPLPAADLRCGNEAVLPGAFSLTGAGPAQVCLDVPDGRACVALRRE